MPYQYYLFFGIMAVLLSVIIFNNLPKITKNISTTKAVKKGKIAIIIEKREYQSPTNERFYYLKFMMEKISRPNIVNPISNSQESDETRESEEKNIYEEEVANDSKSDEPNEPLEYLVPKKDYFLYQVGMKGQLIIKQNCYIKFIPR